MGDRRDVDLGPGLNGHRSYEPTMRATELIAHNEVVFRDERKLQRLRHQLVVRQQQANNNV